MSVAQIVKALQVHAVGSSDASGPGMADVAWRSRDETEVPNLQPVWMDLAQLFQALVPEAPLWRDHGVPVEISYPVAEILSRGSKLSLSVNTEIQREGSLLAWRVATAWEALMAGDIDDVIEHVRGEERALDLDSSGGARSDD